MFNNVTSAINIFRHSFVLKQSRAEAHASISVGLGSRSTWSFKPNLSISGQC